MSDLSELKRRVFLAEIKIDALERRLLMLGDALSVDVSYQPPECTVCHQIIGSIEHRCGNGNNCPHGMGERR